MSVLIDSLIYELIFMLDAYSRKYCANDYYDFNNFKLLNYDLKYICKKKKKTISVIYSGGSFFIPRIVSNDSQGTVGNDAVPADTDIISRVLAVYPILHTFPSLPKIILLRFPPTIPIHLLIHLLPLVTQHRLHTSNSSVISFPRFRLLLIIILLFNIHGVEF